MSRRGVQLVINSECGQEIGKQLLNGCEVRLDPQSFRYDPRSGARHKIKTWIQGSTPYRDDGEAEYPNALVLKSPRGRIITIVQN